MKKIFLAASLVALMAACTGNSNKDSEAVDAAVEALSDAQNDSLNMIVEEVAKATEKLTPAVKEAIANDSELKDLVEKAENGELSQEEKLSLWQKLKKIGGEVVLGTKSATDGATEAVGEVESASKDELADVAKKATDAVGATQAAKDVKNTVDDTKQKLQNVKNALDAFKK